MKKNLIAAAAALTAAVMLAPTAAADGVIDPAEELYADTYWTAICGVISMYPSEGGVLGVADGIVDDGFDTDSAIDVINYAVFTYCPSHVALLKSIGAKYRRAA